MVKSSRRQLTPVFDTNPMWETTFPRNSHAGLGRPFYEQNILTSMKHVRKVPTQSGVAISRKCCFPHGHRPTEPHQSMCDITSCDFFWPRNTKPNIAHRPTERHRSMCDIAFCDFYGQEKQNRLSHIDQPNGIGRCAILHFVIFLAKKYTESRTSTNRTVSVDVRYYIL